MAAAGISLVGDLTPNRVVAGHERDHHRPPGAMLDGVVHQLRDDGDQIDQRLGGSESSKRSRSA